MSKSDTKVWLKEVVELALLYDFYGELLSDSSKEVFEGYVLNDMTLAEISEETGVSRQGIHDTVKRTVNKLRSFENKLHLVEKFECVKRDVEKINEMALAVKEGDNSKADDIIRISRELIDSY
ncbi:MAG: DNA-binding protein [Lachnospiraceae bacterium]|nr:DNA-binding protein [Lachnospiraceae bacterium]